ncbi:MULTISPECIES: FecR family protein [unclassified Pseudomonas]|jgi:transmembrane sensor|uniref:FecR family protein n=1 Tax=unclassified Pseudomonas TaxID=196821 RepID=UPI00026F7A80|nr:FecR family protein [Pseudomonas sp. GM80]EJN31404.1 Fe2+-dicitrate sensor, membrane component [Pseudomonas sp. GM80]EJN31413.1 Fe2+-dicitrate sensor, membrane component [Pseudomonas sp. GM80]
MSKARLDPVSEQAIDWMVKLRAATPDTATQARFDAWLASDRAHSQAWDKLQERLGASFNTVRTLDRRLPGQASEARQVLLQPQASRRDALRVIAGLGLLGGSLWLGSKSQFGESLLADLHTGRGQRQNFNLSDGSRLSLNADSAVDLRFDGQQRMVILRHGELLIDVAPDSRRPLIVRTAEGDMRALGTRFLVAQEQDASRLVVLQHSVEARLFDGTTQIVREGQAAVLSSRTITLASGDERRRADWLNGRLNVLDESLAQVVEALRPYCRGFVRVAPDVRSLRVQGVFPLDDPERTFNALAETLPIRVDRYSPWLTLISKK